MKKIISILLLATFCIFTQLHAQNRADAVSYTHLTLPTT